MIGEKTDVLKDAELFVIDLFEKKLKADMVYHNFNHTKEIMSESKAMAKHYGLSEEEVEKLLLAALFHDTGYVKDYRDHENASKKIAAEFLEERGYNKASAREVLDLIESTRHKHPPKGLLQEILHDADHFHLGKKSFFDRSELIRTEWENILKKNYDDDSWQNEQLQFLKSKQFYTDYARLKYEKRRVKNLSKQTEKVLKSKRGTGKKSRGIETMYRSVYRTHINLSSIADSKANMMISINTIIVSVIMAIVGSGFTFTGRDFIQHMRFTVPMCILLLGCLASVIFAVLSASPNVTNKKVDKKDIKERKSSVLFFGNFVNLELDKFVGSLQMLRDQPGTVYDSMSVDIYFLGHVLQRKYSLLRISYMTFLGSLTLSVVAFLIIFLYSF